MDESTPGRIDEARMSGSDAGRLLDVTRILIGCVAYTKQKSP